MATTKSDLEHAIKILGTYGIRVQLRSAYGKIGLDDMRNSNITYLMTKRELMLVLDGMLAAAKMLGR